MLQSIVRAVLPPQCTLCDAVTEAEGGLCPDCWRATWFISGAVCDKCGVPLVGDDDGHALCDDCLVIARPWDQGRSAFVYDGTGRKLVLSLKHGDRQDVVPVVAPMMARAAEPFLRDQALLVPVPLHWARLFKRRFNQAALLANAIARHKRLTSIPDALIRTRRTIPTEGMGRDDRFALMADAITAHPKHGAAMNGRPVVIVDDVMTSGATLAAATEAAYRAGATRVCVLTLARAVKDA